MTKESFFSVNVRDIQVNEYQRRVAVQIHLNIKLVDLLKLILFYE